MKFKLTVVTTTYNQEKFIEDCIKGVLKQKTNFDFQFIISDDCSTDGTREIINKYKKKYPSIIKTIYRETNLGPMDNFIQTLNEAHTEYVALCDGDDFWTDSSKLQRQVDFLDKNKEYNICFHRVKIFFEDNSQQPVLHPIGIKKELNFADLCKENFIPANSVVYRWIYRTKDSFINDFPKDVLPGDYYVHLMHASRGKIHYIARQMSCYRRNSQGMWWEITQPKLRSKFYHDKGLKMINFYEAVEKKLHLDNSVFYYSKKWLITEMLNSAFVLKKYKTIGYLYNRFYGDYSETFYEFFSNLRKRDKIIYKLVQLFIIKLNRRNYAKKM